MKPFMNQMDKITIYTTRTCPFCMLEKKYLDSQGLTYEEIFVDEKPDEAMKMVEISGQMGVPFTVIDKDNGERVTILGFDQKLIADTLGLT